MEHTLPLLSSVVLIGGQSQRMGQSKYKLTLNGQTFTQKLLTHLKSYKPRLSVHHLVDDYPENIQIIDNTKRIGPIGAIYSSLLACNSQYLLVIACDTPLIDCNLIDLLIKQLLTSSKKAIVASLDDNLQPTFAIYHKSLTASLKVQIDKEDYRLQSWLKTIDYECFQVPQTAAGQLQNINTPNDYNKLVNKQIIFAVSGYKNSGKTTLICELIEHFKNDQMSVACVKHDGHDYQIAQTTDTGKFIASGAHNVTIYSNLKYSIDCVDSFDLKTHITSLNQYDVIILEGHKDSEYPKITISDGRRLSFTNTFLKVAKGDCSIDIYKQIKKEFNVR